MRIESVVSTGLHPPFAKSYTSRDIILDRGKLQRRLVWSTWLFPSFYEARTSILFGPHILLAPWIRWPFFFSYSSFWRTLSKRFFEAYLCVKSWRKKTQQIKFWDLYPQYHCKNVCNYFLLDVHAFEPKSAQKLGSRQPTILLICTSGYNIAIAIINLVPKALFTLSRYTGNLQ